MRTTAALLALLLAACSSADTGTPEDGEALSECELASQCVVEECPQVESVAECLAGESALPEDACDFNTNALFECAERECDAGDDAVGEALASMSEEWRARRCGS
jgi:hypothetical protein